MFEELVKKTIYLLGRKNVSNSPDIYDRLIKACEKKFNHHELNLIKKAYHVAYDLHRGQKRASGEPYIIHPLHVAYIIITEFNFNDVDTIIAALLHDTIEDCGMTKEFLSSMFNDNIATIVESVSKLKKVDLSKEEEDAYNNYLLLQSILKDYRSIIVKLADRLHNMRTLEYKQDGKRIHKSAETLSFYVPLASHIGAGLIREELTDLCFKYLNADSYREINSMRFDYTIKHQEDIEYEISLLRSILGPVNIRPHIKSNFYIYQHLKGKKISEIPNLITYDIMVETSAECYKIMAQLKDSFLTMPEFQKDYIYNPQNNGYQAIHLSIPGHKVINNPYTGQKVVYHHSRINAEELVPVQIKIFTPTMFLINSYGLAAYKEVYKDKGMEQIQEELLARNHFFKEVRANRGIKNPYEFISKTVQEFLNDKIKVYSATFEEYYLPETATVRYFASRIHSDILNNATGALVNGQQVNLDFPLKDGDQIEILVRQRKEEEYKRILKP